MKKIFRAVLLTSLTLLAASCGGQSSSTVNEQSSPLASSIPEPSSEVISSTSKPVSSSQSSSKPVSSSKATSNGGGTVKENELSTSSGLVVKFKAEGASIETIKWGNTQIAKDGFVVGRCANRIKNGKFSINGVEYQADINSNPHSLHGGNGTGWNSWRGPFATANWTKVEQTASSITYTIHSNDGANGYPGNMDMTVKYTLSDEGELLIEYTATTDKDTLCNPTNHLYMNLNNNRNYDNIKLQIDADSYTPLNNQIPTGDISSVANTKFDYRSEIAFKGSEEYDDNYVLNGTGYRKVATMTGSSTGIMVEVFTDRPGLQLYKAGSGDICLESQMFPDMINQPKFAAYGTTILKANEQFYSKTAYCFSKK